MKDSFLCQPNLGMYLICICHADLTPDCVSLKTWNHRYCLASLCTCSLLQAHLNNCDRALEKARQKEALTGQAVADCEARATYLHARETEAEMALLQHIYRLRGNH